MAKLESKGRCLGRHCPYPDLGSANWIDFSAPDLEFESRFRHHGTVDFDLQECHRLQKSRIRGGSRGMKM